MIRHPVFIITVTLSLLLSACVPIPAIPPDPIPAPTAETNAGISDLASGLAKLDQSNNIQSYAQLLDEFVACMQADMNANEEFPELSDTETVAVSFFFAGILSMAQVFAQQFEQALAQESSPYNETAEGPSVYDMLEMALAACLENGSE